MKAYVPVVYTVAGTIEIEGESLEEIRTKARKINDEHGFHVEDIEGPTYSCEVMLDEIEV